MTMNDMRSLGKKNALPNIFVKASKNSQWVGKDFPSVRTAIEQYIAAGVVVCSSHPPLILMYDVQSPYSQ